jgi:anti-sigma B factor antagonist
LIRRHEGMVESQVSSDIDHEEEFSVTTEPFAAGLVIAVTGQADLHTAPELRASIGRAIDQGERRLVIDLADATFVDSMTLGVLLGALKQLNPLDGRLVVVCPNPHLRRVFEITSLDGLLGLAESREEAFARLRGPAVQS